MVVVKWPAAPAAAARPSRAEEQRELPAAAAPVPALRQRDDHDRDERQEHQDHRHHEEDAEAKSEGDEEAAPRPSAERAVVLDRVTAQHRGADAPREHVYHLAGHRLHLHVRAREVRDPDERRSHVLGRAAVGWGGEHDVPEGEPRGELLAGLHDVPRGLAVGGDARRRIVRTRRRHASRRG